MLSALPGMAVAAHRFGSAAFIDCKPPLFRGEGDRVSGGGVSGWMGHKGGGLASLRSPTGAQRTAVTAANTSCTSEHDLKER